MSDRTENWPHRVRPADDLPLSLEEIEDVIAQYPASWRLICLALRRGEECGCRGCLTAMRLTRAEQDAWSALQKAVVYLQTTTAEERTMIYQEALAAEAHGAHLDMVQRAFRRVLTPEELARLRDRP